MSSGGAAKLEFGADVQQALDGITRIELKLGQMEGAMKKVASTSRDAKTAVKSVGDDGAEALKKSEAAAEKMEQRMNMVAAATNTALQAMIALEQQAKKTSEGARSAGQTFMGALAATGDTRAASILQPRFEALSRGTGASIEQISAAYQTTRQTIAAGPGGARAAMIATEQFVTATDTLKMKDAEAQKFYSAAGTMMKQDPTMSAAAAAGRAAKIYEAGGDLGAYAGFAEQLGATPDQATALIIAARRAGQDPGVFLRYGAKIIEAQNAGGQKKTLPGGRVVTTGPAAHLMGPGGAPRNVADVIEAGMSGAIPGFLETYGEGRSITAMTAIQRAGAFPGALADARNAGGTIAQIDREQRNARGFLAESAASQERIDNTKAKETLNRLRTGTRQNRAYESVAAQEAVAAEGLIMDTVLNNPMTGMPARAGMYAGAKISEFTGDSSPAIGGKFIQGAYSARQGLQRAERNYANDPNVYGNAAPNVSVSSPPGSQIRVNVVVENAGTPQDASTP